MKYLICARGDGGGRGLLEIISAPQINSVYNIKRNYAVIAEADGRGEAFEAVRLIVEDYLRDNPEGDFKGFEEWCIG